MVEKSNNFALMIIDVKIDTQTVNFGLFKNFLKLCLKPKMDLRLKDYSQMFKLYMQSNCHFKFIAMNKIMSDHLFFLITHLHRIIRCKTNWALINDMI